MDHAVEQVMEVGVAVGGGEARLNRKLVKIWTGPGRPGMTDES